MEEPGCSHGGSVSEMRAYDQCSLARAFIKDVPVRREYWFIKDVHVRQTLQTPSQAPA